MININPKLEEYIFDELGGVYSPSYLEAVDNLGNDEERNLRYLGTYFPRTFVESYYIYTNLFSNALVYKEFNKLENINVLSIGAGTGGDIIGLLTVLSEKFEDKKICIWSYDGNEGALRYQNTLVEHFDDYTDINTNRIELHLEHVVFNKKNRIRKILKEKNFDDWFHIVQSFKFGNELYNSFVNDNIFYDLMYIAEENLNESGIFVMEDVTIKNWDCKYNPCEMTNQVRKYYEKFQDSDLVYIIPKSCAKWNDLCNYEECFSQYKFDVEHRYEKKGSKVTFKVFMMNPLGTEVLSYIGNENCYLISDRTYCTDDSYYYDQDNPPKYPCESAFEL